MTVLYQQQQNIVSTTSVMQGMPSHSLAGRFFVYEVNKMDIKAIETKYDEKQAITMCYELARGARFEHGETPEVSR